MSAALVLGAMGALGSAGAASAMNGAMSGSSAAIRGAAQATDLPKIEVRGGIRYHEMQTARDGVRDWRDRGVWEAEADLYDVERGRF